MTSFHLHSKRLKNQAKDSGKLMFMKEFPCNINFKIGRVTVNFKFQGNTKKKFLGNFETT